MQLGTIKSVSIGNNLDSDQKTLLIEVEVADPDDIRTVEWQGPPGIDVQPVVGSRVYFEEVSEIYPIATGIDDGIEPADDLETGAKEIYSQNGSSRAAKIRLNPDEEIIVNDGQDFAVKFNELKSAFDQLVQDFNDHIHTTTATVAATPTVGTISPPTASSSASIDSSKVEKVRL